MVNFPLKCSIPQAGTSRKIQKNDDWWIDWVLKLWLRKEHIKNSFINISWIGLQFSGRDQSCNCIRIKTAASSCQYSSVKILWGREQTKSTVDSFPSSAFLRSNLARNTKMMDDKLNESKKCGWEKNVALLSNPFITPPRFLNTKFGTYLNFSPLSRPIKMNSPLRYWERTRSYNLFPMVQIFDGREKKRIQNTDNISNFQKEKKTVRNRS